MINVCILFFTVIFITGCGAQVALVTYSSYTAGFLKGKGVKIEALDKSFVISEGSFTPPFQANARNIHLTPIYSTNSISDRNSLIDSYNLALKNGAKKVIVHHPASSKPLYGVLLLNQRASLATGPAARSYLIDINTKYINEAKNGGISVTFEPVSAGDSSIKLYGWVLWLSDVPFE